jgi:hypothetical protein
MSPRQPMRYDTRGRSHVAFSVEDFHDLVRLLEQHPEWRAELRLLLLTEELLGLPAIVRELAELQRQSAEDLRNLRQVVAELADAQRQTADDLRDLSQSVAEAQRQTAEELHELRRGQDELRRDFGELRQGQDELRRDVGELRRGQDALRDQVGALKGHDLERHYREHAGAYFRQVVRRPRLLSRQHVVDLLDMAEDAGQLTPAQCYDILLADVVVRGRRAEDSAEVYLVVEVSVGIGLDDVERAARRADLLGRLAPTTAAVAGEWITPEAEALADARGVWRVLDGRSLAPGGG